MATGFSKKTVEHTRQAVAVLGAGEEIIRCEVHNAEALAPADATFDAAGSSFGRCRPVAPQDPHAYMDGADAEG